MYSVVVRHALQGREALQLCQRLTGLPDEHVDKLALSLRWVEGIDAAGIAAIVRLFSHLQMAGTTLRLVDVPRGVYRTLSELGLQSAIPIYPQLERVSAGALAPLARPAAVNALTRSMGRRQTVHPPAMAWLPRRADTGGLVLVSESRTLCRPPWRHRPARRSTTAR